MAHPLNIHVECYAGHRAEETPRRLMFGHRAVEVLEVVDRWLSPDHRYFKVHGDDGATYIVRHDAPSGRWELVFYRAAGRSEDDDVPELG